MSNSHYFLSINTELFHQTIIPSDETIHPFLQLKEQGLNNKNSFFDRAQCVRYMLRIPYKNNISHALDAVKSIQDDDTIPIYKRYSFWSTQSQELKLDDHIIHEMHPYFFYSIFILHYNSLFFFNLLYSDLLSFVVLY